MKKFIIRILCLLMSFCVLSAVSFNTINAEHNRAVIYINPVKPEVVLGNNSASISNYVPDGKYDVACERKVVLKEGGVVEVYVGDRIGVKSYNGHESSFYTNIQFIDINDKKAVEKALKENPSDWFSVMQINVGADDDGKSGFTYAQLYVLKEGSKKVKVNDVSFTLKAVEKPDPIKDFVKRLYTKALNRNADPSGLNYWTDALKSGNTTAAEATKGFFISKEMTNLKLSDSEFVERCYQVMMDRKSDNGGKNYWLDRLSNGVGREYVLKGFIDSKEFTAICNKYKVTKGNMTVDEARSKNYGITSFVARCYTKALGRKYDVNGLNDWCSKLLSSSNVKQAAINVAGNGFFNSQEFKNKKLDNTQYIKVLYQTFLGREYDKNGLNYWLKELSSGKSKDFVLNGFANSKEFSNIMASYGIK